MEYILDHNRFCAFPEKIAGQQEVAPQCSHFAGQFSIAPQFPPPKCTKPIMVEYKLVYYFLLIKWFSIICFTKGFCFFRK